MRWEKRGEARRSEVRPGTGGEEGGEAEEEDEEEEENDEEDEKTEGRKSATRKRWLHRAAAMARADCASASGACTSAAATATSRVMWPLMRPRPNWAARASFDVTFALVMMEVA